MNDERMKIFGKDQIEKFIIQYGEIIKTIKFITDEIGKRLKLTYDEIIFDIEDLFNDQNKNFIINYIETFRGYNDYIYSFELNLNDLCSPMGKINKEIIKLKEKNIYLENKNG